MGDENASCNEVPPHLPTVLCEKCRGEGCVKVRIPPERLRGRTCYDHWDYYDFPECQDCGGTGKVLKL